ncbi:Putative ribonuclease H protein At1g65750, partial [Linum perenne]
RFCDASGQAVSKEKFVIFCSKNTDRRTAAAISSTLGIPLTQNLGKYLGVPILHERTTRFTYQEIIDRLDNRLSGWKARSLSLAGRVTLAQSVLTAIPAYAMQTSVLLATTCDAIDKRIRDFVWGSTTDARKIPLIAWNRICLPKDQGGLGLKLARLGARSAIRNGTGTLFWMDRWIDEGSRLVDLAQGNIEDIDLDATVAEMINHQGQWDFSKFLTFLSAEGLDLVAGMSAPQREAGDDEWVWGEEANGKFSIRSAYNLIHSAETSRSPEFWRQIWNWKGPNKIRHFIWLAAHDRLLTNHARKRRNLTEDTRCHWCLHPDETVIHVLRDCSFAQEVWRAIGRGHGTDREWQEPLEVWLPSNLDRDQKFSFGVTCWFLWRSRNERIFESASTPANSVAIKAAVWTDNASKALERDTSWMNVNEGRSVTAISWDPGPSDWVTLNSDGAVKTTSGKASAGGVLRDDRGRILKAYTINLGVCSITRAELRGAITGLELAWKSGFRRILLQMDSTAAISLFEASEPAVHQHALEVIQFKEFMARDWVVRIKHVFREADCRLPC